METANLKDVIAATGGELVQGSLDELITGVSTDTRSIRKGDLFFALIGDNHDGHLFAADALASGAVAAVVSRELRNLQGVLVKVPDTQVALGDLAAWYRNRFDIRAVGITGSVGKTSTKEMVATVLSHRFSILKNQGNFNNEIGVPYTVFQLKPDYDVLIQELAMRLPGEISRLAEIVKPQVGVITNIGLSHIGRLGSQDAIAAAKSELLKNLPVDGAAVLNADDHYFDFLSRQSSAKVLSYGISSGNVRAENIRTDAEGRVSFRIVSDSGAATVHIPLVGMHNVPNALAAATVGLYFGITIEEIADALSHVQSEEKRAQITKVRDFAIYDDTYNASPASMISAINSIDAIECKRRVAVLGDMKELGNFSVQGHRDVGRALARSSVSLLITVGDEATEIAAGAREAGFRGEALQLGTSEEAADAVAAEVRSGDLVLVKGSRSMQMEFIVEALK